MSVHVEGLNLVLLRKESKTTCFNFFQRKNWKKWVEKWKCDEKTWWQSLKKCCETVFWKFWIFPRAKYFQFFVNYKNLKISRASKNSNSSKNRHKTFFSHHRHNIFDQTFVFSNFSKHFFQFFKFQFCFWKNLKSALGCCCVDPTWAVTCFALIWFVWIFVLMIFFVFFSIFFVFLSIFVFVFQFFSGVMMRWD